MIRKNLNFYLLQTSLVICEICKYVRKTKKYKLQLGIRVRIGLKNFVRCQKYLCFKRFYSFIFREGKGGRETSMCGCPPSAPYWGPGPQPWHVPWLGIDPATPWLAVWCSIHWVIPARVRCQKSLVTLNLNLRLNTTRSRRSTVFKLWSLLYTK